MLEHIPNGAMFTFGWWSMIAAAGAPSADTRAVGATVSVLGDVPNEHASIAPEATACPTSESVPVRTVARLHARDVLPPTHRGPRPLEHRGRRRQRRSGFARLSAVIRSGRDVQVQ